MPAAVPRVKFSCLVCKHVFYRRAKEQSRSNHPAKYCSIECRGIGMRKRKRVQCAECGNKFFRARGELGRKKGNRSWCSWKCWKKWQRDKSTSYPKIGNRHAHRVVMENKLGRKLGSDDIVHHKNEDIKDYSLSNLQLTDRPEHARIHFSKPRK